TGRIALRPLVDVDALSRVGLIKHPVDSAGLVQVEEPPDHMPLRVPAHRMETAAIGAMRVTRQGCERAGDEGRKLGSLAGLRVHQPSRRAAGPHRVGGLTSNTNALDLPSPDVDGADEMQEGRVLTGGDVE